MLHLTLFFLVKKMIGNTKIHFLFTVDEYRKVTVFIYG